MPTLGEIKKLPNSQRFIWVACEYCGKERWVLIIRSKPRSKLCRRCNATVNRPHLGKGNGSSPRMMRGYVLIYNPAHPRAHKTGHIKRARLILEQKLGRYLLPNAVPHHINGIKDDDRPENLNEMQDKDHKIFHRRLQLEKNKACQLQQWRTGSCIKALS